MNPYEHITQLHYQLKVVLWFPTPPPLPSLDYFGANPRHHRICSITISVCMSKR